MTYELHWILIGVAAAIAVLLLLWLMLRARIGRQRLKKDETAQVDRTADPYAVSKERPYMKAAAPPEPDPVAPTPPADEPRGAAAASEAVADEPIAVAPAGSIMGDITGIAMPPGATDPSDDLTRLKGVGPKLAALLNAEGITRYSQIGALGDSDLAELDAKLGTFKGRLARDRVVEQARLLASGDREGYEAAFGKLG